jgi:hypothetical protein
MIQIGSKNGMVLMKDSIYKFMNDGLISHEEAASILGEPTKDGGQNGGTEGSF